MARSEELSEERAQQLCHELADLGCQKVTLSGGEPTLRKDWSEIATTLVRRGVRVNIISNGWNWTKDTVQKAVDAQLRSVSCSLDGMEEVHDNIRRKGSFQSVLETFRLCRAAGMTTSSIFTVSSANIKQLDEVHDLLVREGVSMWQIQLVDLMGNMEDHKDWSLNPEELIELEEKVATFMNSSPMRVNTADNIGYFGPHEEVLRKRSPFGAWTGCLAGCTVVGIESNGNVKGCLSQQDKGFVEGNLVEHGLAEVWNRPGAFSYNRDFCVDQLKGFCASCRYNDICRGGCTCSAHFASGSAFDNPYCVYRVLAEKAQNGDKKAKMILAK